MEESTETERLFEEVRDLNERVESLEKANRELDRENQELKQELLSGSEARLTTRQSFKDIDWKGVKPDQDDDYIQKQRYRLLWQNSIRCFMIAHHKGKLAVSRQHASVLQGRLDKETKEVNSLKLSLLEAKKMRETQSQQLDQKKETIKELRQKLEMEKQNTAQEKLKLEEEFNTQITALRATSQGFASDGNLETTLPATHQFGFDEAEALELRERVEELESLLEAAGEEEQGLLATKEALMERVAELEEQLLEYQGVEDHVTDSAAVRDVGATVTDEDMREHLALLERELAMTQKAEREWREKATMSWWSRFNAFCVSPDRGLPKDDVSKEPPLSLAAESQPQPQ